MELDDKYKHIEQNTWLTSSGRKFLVDPEASKLLENLREKNIRSIKEVASIKRGVLFDKTLLKDHKKDSSYFPYFEGDVYRYVVNLKLEKWIAFDEKLKEKPKEFIWFENQRILLRRLVNRQQRLMASVVDDTFISNKNLYSIITKSPRDLHSLLGILNSKLLSYLYLKQVTQAAKDDFPQVTIKDILALPFPTEDILARNHDRLVALVETMLTLHKQLAAARLPDEKERLQRQITTTDRQIDQLVYQLYDLTPEEIAIVEGS